MIGTLAVAVVVWAVHGLVTGAAVDLGPDRVAWAVVVLAGAVGAGIVRPSRPPSLADGLVIAIGVPARGPLCDLILAVFPPGAPAVVLAAVVSLGPVGFVLGRCVGAFQGSSALPSVAGFVLGELLVLVLGTGWVPGLVHGVVVALVLAGLATWHVPLQSEEESKGPGWHGFMVGFCLAMVVLVYRRVVAGYEDPGVHGTTEVMLAVLLPALVVAWPVAVLSTSARSARAFAALGAVALGCAVMLVIDPHSIGLIPDRLEYQLEALNVYANPDRHVALSRRLNTLSLDHPWFREWWGWLLTFAGIVAAATGLCLGSLHRRALGWLFVGVAAAVTAHQIFVDGPLTTWLAGPVLIEFRGPITLLMIAAGVALAGAPVALFRARGLVGLILVVVPFVMIAEDRRDGLEEIRRIGEFGINGFHRSVAGDVAVFATPGPGSSSPEGAARYHTTFTGREPFLTVADFDEPLAQEQESAPADDPGPVSPSFTGMRVAGVGLHSGHDPFGAEGTTGRLTRLFGVPGKILVAGIGAELLALDLTEAGMADDMTLASETLFDTSLLVSLMSATGLDGHAARGVNDPVFAARGAEAGTWDLVVVAPGRAEWIGTSALTSCESVRRLSRLLSPSGRCLVWLDTTGMSTRALRSRLAAFGEVFGENSGAFVEMRELDPPLVLMVGWAGPAGRPSSSELALQLPWPSRTGARTRLDDLADLAGILIRDGPGMVAAAEEGPIHSRSRPVEPGAWAMGGWTALADVADPEARLDRVLDGGPGARPWPAPLWAGLAAHERYSYHLARLRTGVTELLHDVDWETFDVEWKDYAEAAASDPNHPVLVQAVAALIEPLVRESDYTRFVQVYQGVHGERMASWRLALLEAFVQHKSLQPEASEAALARARELGAP